MYPNREDENFCEKNKKNFDRKGKVVGRNNFANRNAHLRKYPGVFGEIAIWIRLSSKNFQRVSILFVKSKRTDPSLTQLLRFLLSNEIDLVFLIT